MSGVLAEPEPAVFAALADPTRWRVLGTLAQQGEGTATTLAAELPVSRPAVIKHLGVLDRAGLVTHRRAGREVRYRVEPARLDATARRIADLAAAWDSRLARLKALAEEQEPGAPMERSPDHR
jgi:DNA-binding transcriptional ArsR family regulator